MSPRTGQIGAEGAPLAVHPVAGGTLPPPNLPTGGRVGCRQSIGAEALAPGVDVGRGVELGGVRGDRPAGDERPEAGPQCLVAKSGDLPCHQWGEEGAREGPLLDRIDQACGPGSS